MTKEIIKRACRGALKFSACIVGVPVKDTIKEVELGCITRTLKRNALWQIQTPQVFKKDLILKAYKRFYHKDNFNDDASLVEKLNVKVRIIVGSYYNIKITTPDDLILAQKIYKIINGK
ncbi:MAG: hypothetical protein FJZ16_04520 [Candidatus Omnitrophica bacterium]|nr:hypothetical protein [Candidatus Omnitrophota bacterium]